MIKFVSSTVSGISCSECIQGQIADSLRIESSFDSVELAIEAILEGKLISNFAIIIESPNDLIECSKVIKDLKAGPLNIDSPIFIASENSNLFERGELLACGASDILSLNSLDKLKFQAK